MLGAIAGDIIGSVFEHAHLNQLISLSSVAIQLSQMTPF